MIRQQENGIDRKKSIIEAAIKIIAHNSFEDCSTIDISKEVGITEPLIYYHFKTKKNLQLAVLDTISKRILSWVDILIKLPSLTLTQSMQTARLFQEEMSTNPDRMTVLLKSTAMEDTDIRKKMWDIFQAFHKAIKMVLDKLENKGNANIDEQFNSEAWILLFWIVLLFTMNLLEKNDTIPEEHVEWMVALNDKRLQAILKNAESATGVKGRKTKNDSPQQKKSWLISHTRQKKNVIKGNQAIKQRMSAEERKRSIIEAAISVIARTSFDKCSNKLIVKEAGITGPMIYRHFNSKRDLQIAVIDTILKDILTFLDENINDLPSLTFPQLRDYGKQFRYWITKNPAWTIVLLKSFALEDKDAREKLWEIIESLQKALKSVIIKVSDNKKPSSDVMINLMSWSLLSWFFMTSFINMFGNIDAYPEDQVDWYVSYIEDMLKAGTLNPL